eukprot:4488688-Pyramimonas_sp.AAC.1
MNKRVELEGGMGGGGIKGGHGTRPDMGGRHAAPSYNSVAHEAWAVQEPSYRYKPATSMSEKSEP